LDKGREAIDNLIKENGFERENIVCMECDFSSFDSVRKFATLFNLEEERLDIFICNAGLGYPSNIITSENLNNVIQVNYLSHFLLPNL
jgi:NAD(P)-dependent dehydrogenase (short-subunit alcohol dehydrogenase family)